MSNGTKYRYCLIVSVFTFIGPWIGGLLLYYGFSFYSFFTKERMDILILLTDLIWSPISAISGCFFIPSAFVTGLIAALFRLRRKLFSLVLISVIGAILSFLQATLLFEHGSMPVWLMFSGLGFCASYMSGRLTFPVVNIESEKMGVP